MQKIFTAVLILFAFTLFINGCSEKKKSKKNASISKNKSEIPVLESRTENYMNGQIMKTWTVTMDSLGNYVEHGAVKVWHENGEKASEGFFFFGQIDGHWYTWYDNGKVMEDINFIQGTYDGVYRTYYKNGQAKLHGKYRMGLPVGLWIEWSEYGSKLAELNIDISGGYWSGTFHDYDYWMAPFGFDSASYKFNDNEGFAQEVLYNRNGNIVKTFWYFKDNRVEQQYNDQLFIGTPVDKFQNVFIDIDSDQSLFKDSTIRFNSLGKIESIKVNDVEIYKK